jgi:hypothetical protein
MTKYIAVKGWGLGDIRTEVKRAAVLFDHVAIRHVHSEGDCASHRDAARELDWLVEKKIVIPAPETVGDQVAHPWLRDYPPTILSDPMTMVRAFILEEVSNRARRGKGQQFIDDIEGFRERYFQTAADVYARVAAATLQNEETVALPLLGGPFDSHPIAPSTRADVVGLVFDRIHVPGPETPWEAIMEWREDPAAREKFKQLRAWINKTARERLPRAEVQDEIEALLASYCNYMDLQHKKIPKGTFRVICTAVAEVCAALPLINLSPLLDVLFHAHTARVDLLIIESEAPGRELAYIVAANAAAAGWGRSTPAPMRPTRTSIPTSTPGQRSGDDDDVDLTVRRIQALGERVTLPGAHQDRSAVFEAYLEAERLALEHPADASVAYAYVNLAVSAFTELRSDSSFEHEGMKAYEWVAARAAGFIHDRVRRRGLKGDTRRDDLWRTARIVSVGLGLSVPTLVDQMNDPDAVVMDAFELLPRGVVRESGSHSPERWLLEGVAGVIAWHAEHRRCEDAWRLLTRLRRTPIDFNAAHPAVFTSLRRLLQAETSAARSKQKEPMVRKYIHQVLQTVPPEQHAAAVKAAGVFATKPGGCAG